MTDHDHTQAVSDRDRLITRVIDGEASAQDWARMAHLAAEEPGLWADVAERQADRDALTAAVEEAIAIADDIDADASWERFASAHRPTMARLRTWGGWVAAAVIALVVVSRGGVIQTTPPGGDGLGSIPATNSAGLEIDLPTSELLKRYLQEGKDEGTVVSAAEPVVLEARPAENNEHLEVIVLRRIIERRYVDRVPTWSVDEQGQVGARPVRVRDATRPRHAF